MTVDMIFLSAMEIVKNVEERDVRTEKVRMKNDIYNTGNRLLD